MTYTDPPTFVADDVLEADQLNVLSDDIRALASQADGFTVSACQVSRSTNQSISDSTDTYATFTTENIDIGGWYPGSGNKCTVPAGAVPAGATSIGLWLSASVKFASNSTGKRRIEIHVNGSSIGQQQGPGLDGGDSTIIQIAGELAEVEAGDEIQLNCWQSSGGALNIQSAKLQFHRIGVIS